MECTDPHGDLGLLILAGPPENEREEGEEDKEADDEGEEVAPARQAPLAVLVIEQPLLLDDGAILPLLVAAALPAAAAAGAFVRGDLAGSGLQRPGEPAGRRLAGVAADGGVGVGWGRRGAERRRGVERSRGLLAVVGIAGRALDIVGGPARGSGGRRRGDAAGDFGICLGVHFGNCQPRTSSLALSLSSSGSV